jgi:demethylmenaquinone methyltransferase/2-methoxy-6-polyprenyl-1,4-benzoquinol methylase
VTVWGEVEDALEEIIGEYEKVNHVISLYQDDRNRRLGLRLVKGSRGVGLELGSGPGNFSRLVATVHSGPLVCLDFSDRMLWTGRARNRVCGFNYVRAVFEALPFRDSVFDLVTASYALRDTLDKPKAFSEAGSVTAPGGRFLLVDIGKPDNPLFQGFMGLYMRFMVPIMGGLTAGYGYRNPWSLLYKTYDLLPSNDALKGLILRHWEKVEMRESMFGAMVVAVGTKPVLV